MILAWHFDTVLAFFESQYVPLHHNNELSTILLTEFQLKTAGVSSSRPFWFIGRKLRPRRGRFGGRKTEKGLSKSKKSVRPYFSLKVKAPPI